MDLSRRVATRDKKKAICVVTEGRTEVDYLNCLKNTSHFDDSTLELKIADKTILDRDDSDRMSMVEFAEGWRILISNGSCPIRMYVSIVLDDYYRCCNSNRGILPDLCRLREELCSDNTLFDSRSTVGGNVPKGSTLYRDIFARCQRVFPDGGDPSNLPIPNDLCPEKRPNREFYIMFDRDYDRDRRDAGYYNAVLDRIDKDGFHALVSTPQIEVWLLMHFEDALFDDISFNSFSGFIESRLGEFDRYEQSDRRKYIDDGRFDEYYRESIPLAITTSLDGGRFVTNPRELENQVGTNVGLFLKDVLGIKGL